MLKNILINIQKSNNFLYFNNFNLSYFFNKIKIFYNLMNVNFI